MTEKLDVKKLWVKSQTVANARTRAEQQDKVDRFLETIRGDLPELDLEVEGVVDRIHGLSRRFRRSMDETLAEHGFGFADWKILNALRRGGSPYRRSPGELAKWTDLSSGAMTNRLDRLEEAGYIRRLPDPDDRRALKIELTDGGHRAYEEAVGAQAAKESLVASVLSEREQRQLNALLRRLMLEFESQGGDNW